MGTEMEDLRRATEQNREKIEAMGLDISVLKVQHSSITHSLDEKHAQNRKDIHALRGEIEKGNNRSYLQVEELRETIHKMQLTSAKAKGYYLGAGAALAFVLDVLKIAIEHFSK